MRINNDFEYQAARALCKKYGFQPNRSKHHPLQASMRVVADAMKNYEQATAFMGNTTRKAA